MIVRSCRASVAQERCRRHCFTPVTLGHFRVLDHTSSTLEQRPTPLSWAARVRKLLYDALGLTERKKLDGHVFAAVVAADHFDATTSLGLGKLDELHKLVQHF